jgi:hypothetical protein
MSFSYMLTSSKMTLEALGTVPKTPKPHEFVFLFKIIIPLTNCDTT